MRQIWNVSNKIISTMNYVQFRDACSNLLLLLIYHILWMSSCLAGPLFESNSQPPGELLLLIPMTLPKWRKPVTIKFIHCDASNYNQFYVKIHCYKFLDLTVLPSKMILLALDEEGLLLHGRKRGLFQHRKFQHQK